MNKLLLGSVISLAIAVIITGIYALDVYSNHHYKQGYLDGREDIFDMASAWPDNKNDEIMCKRFSTDKYMIKELRLDC